MIQTQNNSNPQSNFVTQYQLRFEFEKKMDRKLDVLEDKIDNKLDKKFKALVITISAEVTAVLADSLIKIDKTLLEIKQLREDIKDHEIRIRRVEDKTGVIRINS